MIRIVLENGLRLPLTAPMKAAVWAVMLDIEFAREDEAGAVVHTLDKRGFPEGPELSEVVGAYDHSRRKTPAPDDARIRATTGSLLAFFADRLKVYLREKGARHDLIDAVFALPGQDDLLLIVRRVEALGLFPRYRRRAEPARRLSPRRQHPARRGKEGRRRGVFALP